MKSGENFLGKSSGCFSIQNFIACDPESCGVFVCKLVTSNVARREFGVSNLSSFSCRDFLVILHKSYRHLDVEEQGFYKKFCPYTQLLLLYQLP